MWEGEVQGKNKAAQEYRKQRSEDRQVVLTRVLEAYTQMMTAVATSITTIAGGVSETVTKEKCDENL